jgi:uncharacterized protein YutE (UPF0331/DUF86 family)
VTDRGLVAKKLAEIETYVRELRQFADPDAIATDLVQQRFAERTLQIAMQAALDAASHIVSDERLGEPNTNRELFEKLASDGWIPEPLSARLQGMAGMRNILVHAYGDVDAAKLADAIRNDLDDLLSFAAAIRDRIR